MHRKQGIIVFKTKKLVRLSLNYKNILTTLGSKKSILKEPPHKETRGYNLNRLELKLIIHQLSTYAFPTPYLNLYHDPLIHK